MAASETIDILKINLLSGSGAPTGISAPPGSIYVNTTGTTTATHLYVNNSSTTGVPGTGWVAVTTVAT